MRYRPWDGFCDRCSHCCQPPEQWLCATVWRTGVLPHVRERTLL